MNKSHTFWINEGVTWNRFEFPRKSHGNYSGLDLNWLLFSRVHSPDETHQQRWRRKPQRLIFQSDLTSSQLHITRAAWKFPVSRQCASFIVKVCPWYHSYSNLHKSKVCLMISIVVKHQTGDVKISSDVCNCFLFSVGWKFWWQVNQTCIITSWSIKYLCL